MLELGALRQYWNKMKDSIYYVKLHYDSNSISKKDIINFLILLDKIENIQFFFVFLDKSGFEAVKKMKKIQIANNLKFYGSPIITNDFERRLTKRRFKETEQLLLIVAKHNKSIKSAMDGIITRNKKLFYNVNKKITQIHNVDIVTPLNMRNNDDVLRLSFLISKYAIKLLALKRNLDLKNFPNMFLGVAFIFDFLKTFNKRRILKDIIQDYYHYLLDYFKFSKKEILDLDKIGKKYISMIKKINREEFDFQKNRAYLDVVGTLHNTLAEDNLLAKIDNKLYGMLFHWFNNSLDIHFTHEVVLVFILKNYYGR